MTNETARNGEGAKAQGTEDEERWRGAGTVGSLEEGGTPGAGATVGDGRKVTVE